MLESDWKKFVVALSGPSYCRHADFESGVAATARHLSTKQQPSIRNPIASAQGRAFPTGPGESGQRQTKREREKGRKGDKEMPGGSITSSPPDVLLIFDAVSSHLHLCPIYMYSR
jgi:hypothetical protein